MARALLMARCLIEICILRTVFRIDFRRFYGIYHKQKTVNRMSSSSWDDDNSMAVLPRMMTAFGDEPVFRILSI